MNILVQSQISYYIIKTQNREIEGTPNVACHLSLETLAHKAEAGYNNTAWKYMIHEQLPEKMTAS